MCLLKLSVETMFYLLICDYGFMLLVNVHESANTGLEAQFKVVFKKLGLSYKWV